METTTLPGFADSVHEAQRTFKGLLEALAHPGQIYSPTVTLNPPDGLTPMCAAVCLTLMDLETTVWLQPSLPNSVKYWLRFHTGCRFSDSPAAATFAVISDAFSQPDLKSFSWGSAEDPEKSTTLLIQVEDLDSGKAQQLNGPGILRSVALAPALPETFWQQWASNHSAYPQGVDCFLFTQRSVVGLPRTVRIHSVLST